MSPRRATPARDDEGDPPRSAGDAAPVVLAGAGQRSEAGLPSVDRESTDKLAEPAALAEVSAATRAPASEPVPGDRLRATDDPSPPSAVMPVPMPQSRGHSGWPLAVALTGLAAALLLVFFLPRILWPDEATSDVGLTARVERGQQPNQVQPPAHPQPRPDLRSGSPTEPGEVGGASRVDPALTDATRGAEPTLTDTTVRDPEPATDTTTGDPTPTGDPTTLQAVGESGKASDATAHHPDSGGERPPTISVSDQIDEGCSLVRSGDAKLGVEVLLKAHDRKPGDMRLLLCLADGHSKLGNFQSAANFYERVLEKSGRHRIALLGAAQAYEAMNHRAAARIFYQRLLDQEPRNVSARAFFAEEDGLAKPP